jgi:hypothetical protein
MFSVVAQTSPWLGRCITMSTTLLRSRMPTRSECKHKPPGSPSTSNSVPEVHVSGRLNIAKPIQRLRPPFLRHQAEAQITICAKPHTGRTPVAHPAYARRKKKIKITLLNTDTVSAVGLAAKGRECRNNRPRDDLPNSWKGS